MGFCMPTQEEMKTKGEAIYTAMSASMGNMTRYMDDVGTGWKIILVCGIISFFITLIYLYLLRWITKNTTHDMNVPIFLCVLTP